MFTHLFVRGGCIKLNVQYFDSAPSENIRFWLRHQQHFWHGIDMLYFVAINHSPFHDGLDDAETDWRKFYEYFPNTHTSVLIDYKNSKWGNLSPTHREPSYLIKMAALLLKRWHFGHGTLLYMCRNHYIHSPTPSHEKRKMKKGQF